MESSFWRDAKTSARRVRPRNRLGMRFSARLFINNAAGKNGEVQPGGGNVLETLLSLILSEKAGINISGDASASRPLEDFIQKFTGNGGQSDRGQAKQETASTATAGKRDNSG